MTKPNLTKHNMISIQKVIKLPNLFLLGVGLCFLPACAVIQPAKSVNVSHIEKTTPMKPSVKSSSDRTVKQGAHYKFESKNPRFANLGRYDSGINSAYIRNRNAMALRPVKEDARSRFAPQPSTPKSSSGASLNSFLKTYGAAPQATQVKDQAKGHIGGMKAYDFSKFDQNGFDTNRSLTHTSKTTDIAFVNVKGKTDTRDWDICARENQGVFDQSVIGFKLKESFETCMRQRGYQPEEEAVQTMMAKPLPVSATTERADEKPIATYPSLKGFSRMDTSLETKPIKTQARAYSDVLAGGY